MRPLTKNEQILKDNCEMITQLVREWTDADHDLAQAELAMREATKKTEAARDRIAMCKDQLAGLVPMECAITQYTDPPYVVTVTRNAPSDAEVVLMRVPIVRTA